MRILSVHNHYQMPGGEDEVFQAEAELLRAAGHDVIQYTQANEKIALGGLISRARLASGAIWARDSYRALRGLIRSERPEVAHFHNIFPLVSPSAYSACREAGVPVVQSLHNSRLLCPAGTFYRQGRLCEDCLGRIPWPGVVHGCYRKSRAQTGVVAAMLTLHRLLHTWREKVDMYVVFTEFYRRKFAEGGLPAEKITVKPHFVSPDPGRRSGVGNYALFAGRLAPEKGVRTLMEAWSRLKGVPLQIRGDGPMRRWLMKQAGAGGSPTKLIPRLTAEQMLSLMKGSRFLVWPSEGYYESFGLIAIEAFACGIPVIASRIGAMEEIVEDGRTGLHFAPGDPRDLAMKVEWAWTHPREMQAMGSHARAEYEAKYTPERNYQLLMQIYQRVLAVRQPAPR